MKEAVGLPINISFPAPLFLPLVLYGGWNMSLFNQAESWVGSRSQVLEFQKLFFFHRNMEYRMVWQKYIHLQKFYILLSIDISMKNINLYALRRPKLNFGSYLIFDSTF